MPAPRRPLLLSLLAASAALPTLADAAPTTADDGPRAAAARTTMSSGHADYGVRFRGGRLRSAVKDATGGGTVWRRPGTVVARLRGNARVRLPQDNRLSFLGRAGSRAWVIPQTQRAGVLWLGWNTEMISSSQVRGPLRWTLKRVRGPGRVAVWQTGSFGASDVLFNSSRPRPGTRTVPLGVHAHGNWAFTRKGTYRLTFVWSGRSTSGKRLRSSGTLRVKVG